MPEHFVFQPHLLFHCSRTGSSSCSHMLTPRFPHLPSKQPMLSLLLRTASHFSSAHLISTHCFCNLALPHLPSCLFLEDHVSCREERRINAHSVLKECSVSHPSLCSHPPYSRCYPLILLMRKPRSSEAK